MAITPATITMPAMTVTPAASITPAVTTRAANNRRQLLRTVMATAFNSGSHLPRALVTTAVIITASLYTPSSAVAQSVEADIRQTIESLFDGMRAGDSTVVRSVFSEGAVMGRPVKDDGGTTRVTLRPVDRFVAAVGRPHDATWDERIGHVHIRIDGELASAWMEYEFYLGDVLHHCGVNSMQLVRFDSGWKITTLLDTDRGLDCRLQDSSG